jgi:propanol-preferring alcohol dehydrogenase
VLAGATVYGVDIRPEVFAAALEAGARECFTDVRELGALRPHMIIDFAGVGTSTSAALRAVRPGGRVVVVGLGARETTVRTHDLVTRFKTLRGSLGATKQDLREVYALLAGGEMTPLIEEAPFDDLNAALDRLRRGEVRGRLVTRPG